MKIRFDFVTNSSSSSHIVLISAMENGDSIRFKTNNCYPEKDLVPEEAFSNLRSPIELVEYLYLDGLFLEGFNPFSFLSLFPDFSDFHSIFLSCGSEYEDMEIKAGYHVFETNQTFLNKSEKRFPKRSVSFVPYAGPPIALEKFLRPLSNDEKIYNIGLTEKRQDEIRQDIIECKKKDFDTLCRMLRYYVRLLREAMNLIDPKSNVDALAFALLSRVIMTSDGSNARMFEAMKFAFSPSPFPDYDRFESMIKKSVEQDSIDKIDKKTLIYLKGTPGKALYKSGLILCALKSSIELDALVALNAYRSLF